MVEAPGKPKISRIGAIREALNNARRFLNSINESEASDDAKFAELKKVKDVLVSFSESYDSTEIKMIEGCAMMIKVIDAVMEGGLIVEITEDIKNGIYFSRYELVTKGFIFPEKFVYGDLCKLSEAFPFAQGKFRLNGELVMGLNNYSSSQNRALLELGKFKRGEFSTGDSLMVEKRKRNLHSQTLSSGVVPLVGKDRGLPEVEEGSDYITILTEQRFRGGKVRKQKVYSDTDSGLDAQNTPVSQMNRVQEAFHAKIVKFLDELTAKDKVDFRF